MRLKNSATVSASGCTVALARRLGALSRGARLDEKKRYASNKGTRI
jgi:hypothetical protein